MHVNRRFKTFLLLFLIAAVSLTASGCWNRREIQNLTINTALGFDRVMVDGQPRILLSVLTMRPTGAAGGMAGGGGMSLPRAGGGLVVSSDGETIYDAVRNWNLRSSRQLFLAHSLAIVIGEDMAREGIGQIVDFCNRHKDVRKRSWVFVCQGTAQDALQAQPEFETLVSREMADIIQQNTPRVSKSVGENLFQVMYDLLTPGKEAVVSWLKLFTPPEKGSPLLQAGSAGGTPGSPGKTGEPGNEQPQVKVIAIAGSAAFLGDRLVGLVDEEESQGMLFIRDQARAGIIPVAFDATDKNASFLLHIPKTRVKPVINEDGSIMFEVDIKGMGELLEEKNAVIDISEEDLRQTEALINQEVERRCLKAVARSQELRSDVLGFGDKLYRTKPKAWKEIKDQWGEVFPTVKVSVRADFHIAHFGILSKPIVVE